jgi:hypothetical protein
MPTAGHGTLIVSVVAMTRHDLVHPITASSPITPRELIAGVLAMPAIIGQTRKRALALIGDRYQTPTKPGSRTAPN